LIDDPALLASLRAGVQRSVVRTVDEQAAGLRDRYRSLLAPANRPAPASVRMERVLFVTGIEGAPLRYRVRLPAEALGLIGVRTAVRHYRDPDLLQIAKDADAVVVYRVPATPRFLDFMEGPRRRGVPLFFDVDDLIFDPGLASETPSSAAPRCCASTPERSLACPSTSSPTGWGWPLASCPMPP
jgi:hypothetical protein